MKYIFIAKKDDILTEELKNHISKRFYKNLKFKKTVFYVNGKEIEGWKKIEKGDEISFFYEKDMNENWPLYESKIDIRFENENYLVVSKENKLLSIPKKSDPKSLYQEVLYYLKNNDNTHEVSIINRLDYDTKGLCLIAKNRFAAAKMSPVHDKMKRKYIALLEGHLDNKSGVIDKNIKKEEDSIKRIISNDLDSKRAITKYNVLKEFDNYSLVEFELLTGRTHQIRCHASSIGNPIVGDILYGAKESDKIYLFSYYLEFIDEISNEEVKVEIKKDEINKWLEKIDGCII